MSRTRRDTHSLLLAGWLFADLLAMLFVISLASAQHGAAASGANASPSPSNGNSASASPGQGPGAKPSTSPPPTGVGPGAKVGLDPTWAVISVSGIDLDELRRDGDNGAMAKSIVNQMTASLAKVPGGNRTVGLIATFTQTPRDVDRGDSMSKLVDAALIAHQPQFAHAAQLPLWQAGAEGTVNLKVFFINQ